MTAELSRRALLAGVAAGMGSAAFAKAPDATMRPLPRGEKTAETVAVDAGEAIVERAGLGGVTTYALIDADSGELIDGRQHGRAMPPASTMKALTAIYALERLGPKYQFSTRLLATGPIVNGKLEGDLVLVGGGDPTLDTDRLADLGIALREAGVSEVSGRFLIWGDALPRGDRIGTEQPEHVAYNPAYCGLNLNFNRVHFEWKPREDAFDITMQARGIRFQPSTNVSRMGIVEREAPVFDYRRGNGVDRWTVSKWALGKRDGARWLPVRFPALYAADVFRTLARSNGVVLPPAELVSKVPGGQVVASVESPPLTQVMAGMLRYSTNLTAEVAGMMASTVNGVPINSLVGSGSRMAGWAETQFGARGMQIRDHSGLGYGSSISASSMSEVLRQNAGVGEIMRPMRVPDPGRSDGQPMDGVEVTAKTGTLNFVSTLTGFLTVSSGRKAVFAIFSADTARRDAVPIDRRERPRGSKSYANRSRTMQRALLAAWAQRLKTS